MKVKPVEYRGQKLVKFWCPGCGQFHTVAAALWNGDADKPTISLDHTGTGSAGIVIPEYMNFGLIDTTQRFKCSVTMEEGKLFWASSCTHRLAGKSLPMQHEEAWRDGGNDWATVKPPDGSKPEIKT